ncbi:MAG: terminase small subunit, partial [Muribaculaceae bacterium]|nr:terminase small subunit [Muribaculaceae bacterium]
EMFCRHYVEIGNASEAYRLSYNCANMKQSTIWRNASALLDNNKVATRIAELQKEYAEATRVDRAKVEKVLMGIVEVDPSDMYYIDEETGKVRLKSPNQMPTRMRKALKKIKNKFGEITYEFNGKTEAAALLAKMNGWEAPTTVNLTGKGELLLAPKKKD